MNTNKRGWKSVRSGLARRVLSLALAAVTLWSLLPRLTPEAEAAEWMEPYLETLVDWGVMRGSNTGDLNPDRVLTRAEFVTMVNRAFGYTERGATPFQDVPENAWYADDINIAYQAGYFQGTSETTAGPMGRVTREQAAVMLGRNLRMQGIPGVNSDFSDFRDMGNWSRGMVQECAEMGIIQGYSDGTFRPRNYITRGQMACFLVRALGTLVKNPGEQIAGGVYGNLTVNSPGVKLRDTVVTGNLYLTGGVGLGNVELENVTVMGKIVVCGAGEAERGQNSIILRNVTAEGLEIDSLTDHFMSVRTEGLTNIANTTVRTSAYLEDVTDDDQGLRVITLDGADGTQLQLAGNIKEVVNITPNSDLRVVQGITHKLTVDEQATGSALSIANDTTVKILNLDAATPVTGNGDVDKMNINAAGSSATMLPDSIFIRPGIDSNINNKVMDSIAAAESSDDPRLLSGYPLARNIGSTTAEAVFSTNKRGTVYWAVSSLLDGSMGEDELRNPTAYPGKILRSGTLNVTASKTEMIARITGLTQEGSYYISAMLVDDRGRASPVKVAVFTTTDNSAPAFSTGYPYTIVTVDDEDDQVIQAMVMATKSCKLYYALLPLNSTAPSTANLRAGAIPGNLGYGVVDLRKNTPHLISRVNSSHLAEDTSYDLYLWLNDADSNKSSAVRKLTVRTLDRTPPTIQHLTVTDMTATSVRLTSSLDEPGTIYWAVVRRGAEFYAPGIESPEDLMAKIQVESGTGALKKGNVKVGKAGTDVTINITGLAAQTAYDLYYVAKDLAGNYNVYTQNLTPPMEINTLDNEGPTVKQEFTHDGSEGSTELTPYPDTSIRLVFSESVQGVQNVAGKPITSVFQTLYNNVLTADSTNRAAREEELAAALRYHIKLYEKPISGQPEVVLERNGQNEDDVGEDWIIDYRKATVTMDNSGSGEMIITFPHDSELSRSGLNLASGTTYYFELQGIVDTSAAANPMVGVRGVTKLQEFTTIDAQMVFSLGTNNGKDEDGNQLLFDMNFRLTPLTAASVSEDTLYDLLFWSDTSMKFELYYRNEGDTYWTQMKKGASTMAEFRTTVQTPTVGLSIARELRSDGPVEKTNPNFEKLKYARDREYGIIIRELNGSPDSERDSWTGSVAIRVTPVSGTQTTLNALSSLSLTPSAYSEHQRGIYKVKEIGVPVDYTVTHAFQDSAPPTFTDGYPVFDPGDSGVRISFALSRPGLYYYVIAPLGYIPTDFTYENASGATVTERLTESNWSELPEDGTPFKDTNNPNATLPVSSSITNPSYTGSSYQMGSGSNGAAYQEIMVTDLTASTKYVAYFVLQGQSQNSISNVYAFRFETVDVVKPIIGVSVSNPSAGVQADRPADIKWLLLVDGTASSPLSDTIDWQTPNPDYGFAGDYTEEQFDKFKTMTVLEAMSEYLYSNGRNLAGSVFDLYGSDAQKNQVVNYMNTASPSSGSIAQVGNMIHPGSWKTITENCRGYMNPNNPNMEYWFVAMGSSQGASGYAFAAASGLFYPDNTPPQAITISTEVNADMVLTDDPKAAENLAYSGTVTITFSTDLYYRDNSSSPTRYLQVVDKPLTATLDSTKYISSGALVSAAGIGVDPQVPATSTTNPTCRTLILTFTARRTGNNFSLNQNLSNIRGITGSKPLTLTMDLVKNSRGMYVPRYSITSGSDWGNPSVTP